MHWFLPLGSLVTIQHDPHWGQQWWYRTSLYQQHRRLRYASWSVLPAMVHWDHPWVRTDLHHRSNLWPSVRQSTQRPERESWEVPAQTRHLRTNPLTGNHQYWQSRGLPVSFTCFHLFFKLIIWQTQLMSEHHFPLCILYINVHNSLTCEQYRVTYSFKMNMSTNHTCFFVGAL